MIFEDLMGRIWSVTKEKVCAAIKCVACLPRLISRYKQLRRQSFSRKAAWFCTKNTKF